MIIDILWYAFFMGVSVQFIYIIIIFGRFSFLYRSGISQKSPGKTEGVTVIIAAHNEKDNLKKLIPVLFQQRYANFDVMIINDRSYDGTKRLLEKMMVTYPRLRTVTIDYTPDHVTAKKYALTLGIKVAKNDIMLLTDADCIPQSENWIDLMSAPLRDDGKTFSLGFSQHNLYKGLLNRWIQFETLWTGILYMSFALWKAPFMGVGRNLCYRKSFFMEKKAFKGLWHIACGDDDLFVNLYANGKNTAVVIHPESVTLTQPKTDWKGYFLQKKRHFHAGKFYSAGNKLKVGLYSFSHLIFGLTGLALLIFLGLDQEWEQFSVIIGIMIIRSILLTSVFTSARKKLEGKSKVYWTMFFDLMYLGYFWIIGAMGYQSKKVRWK